MVFNRQKLRVCRSKPRVFIVSDISNEPDDAESLVRYLLYSNEFNTRGLVACTSTWMKRVVHPEDMEKIVRAYAQIFDNLNHHVHPDNLYPHPDHILSLIRTGPALYGKEALEAAVPLSDGAKLLIERLDESDDALWVLCWGGTNVLAQALQHIQQKRSEEESARLRSKIRVYAISDQDDTGMWIRQSFPDIFYISSTHGWNQYGLAAWTGISGDKFYGFDQGGPDFTKLTKEWLKEHIQIGPLGRAYPDYQFIPEGDTPTFLYLVQNGLGSSEHPNWGSWGGRYALTDLGQAGLHYSDVADRVVGLDGKTYASNHATIWRWRDSYQNDFAARMQWTISADPSTCNHAPVALVNESTPGPEPLLLEAEVGAQIVLDASQSYDPDEDELTFTWFQYKDITATQWMVDAEVATIDIENLDEEKAGRKVRVRLPPAERCAVDMFSGEPKEKGQVFHFILELKDSGTPSLTAYKRVVVQVTDRELRGRRDKAVESIAEVHWSV
ncbi:hypothetical protein H2198_008033 [Neophaeococcomyces mojaviensis]|uniref:Uncharacterized protein n=1 Tax=Neophaeococcomyces mojaviensis TaxID=3383035 RepID=A0ACC2ZY89_9EURO|nr:hypothetical protein H2198_008033 [Knufia sp. JES_112]